MDITSKIQRLRRDKGWSVARLARETDIPAVSLRVMLTRDDPNNYNIKSLMRIAEVLGVTVSYLTLEEDELSKPKISELQYKDLINMFKNNLEQTFEIIKSKNKSPYSNIDINNLNALDDEDFEDEEDLIVKEDKN